jgi:hypothetical protein
MLDPPTVSAVAIVAAHAIIALQGSSMVSITIREIDHRPEHFSTYIDQVGEGDLHQRLRESLMLESLTDLAGAQRLASWAYAPGKWSVSELFQHLIDSERIFSYRALRFARGDRQALPGFEQDDYVRSAARDPRPFTELLDELRLVRRSSIALFSSFGREALLARGVCSGVEICAASLGFAIVGHQQHHLRILRERYLSSPAG